MYECLITFISILEVRKWRLREEKCLVQGHTAQNNSAKTQTQVPKQLINECQPVD